MRTIERVRATRETGGVPHQFTGGGSEPPIAASVRAPTIIARPSTTSSNGSVGYSVNDDNFQQANTDASRTPLEKYYAEFVATRKQTEAQVLVSPRIGQVLAVGGVPVQ